MNTYRRSGAGRVRGPRHVYVPDTHREQERVAARANLGAWLFIAALVAAVVLAGLAGWVVLP